MINKREKVLQTIYTRIWHYIILQIEWQEKTGQIINNNQGAYIWLLRKGKSCAIRFNLCGYQYNEKFDSIKDEELQGISELLKYDGFTTSKIGNGLLVAMSIKDLEKSPVANTRA